MRGIVFTFVYYLLSVTYVLVSLPFLILPGLTDLVIVKRPRKIAKRCRQCDDL